MSERATRLNADERYELALAGESSARRNRPSHLVVVAGLVFVAACAALGFTSCQASGAAEDLARRTEQRDDIAALLAQLTALEADGPTTSDNLTAPYPGFRSKMEEIATNVGLEAKLPFPREDRRPDVIGANRVTFEYTITNPTLGPLLQFIEQGAEQIPGTHIARLRIVPKREQWEMGVTFERWERTN